jgi:hypothetical protein
MPLVIRIYLYYPSIIHTLEGMGSPTPPQGRIKDIFPAEPCSATKGFGSAGQRKVDQSASWEAGSVGGLEGWTLPAPELLKNGWKERKIDKKS